MRQAHTRRHTHTHDSLRLGDAPRKRGTCTCACTCVGGRGGEGLKRAAGRKGGGLAVVSVITSEPSNWVSRHSASVRSLAARFAPFSHPLSLPLSLSLCVALSLVRSVPFLHLRLFLVRFCPCRVDWFSICARVCVCVCSPSLCSSGSSHCIPASEPSTRFSKRPQEVRPWIGSAASRGKHPPFFPPGFTARETICRFHGFSQPLPPPLSL